MFVSGYDWITELSFFKNLDDTKKTEVKHKIASLDLPPADLIEYKDGDILFGKREELQDIKIIIEGNAYIKIEDEIRKSKEKVFLIKPTHKQQVVLGEMELIGQNIGYTKTYSKITVIAEGKVKVYSISLDTLKKLLTIPEFTSWIVKGLADKLQLSYKTLEFERIFHHAPSENKILEYLIRWFNKKSRKGCHVKFKPNNISNYFLMEYWQKGSHINERVSYVLKKLAEEYRIITKKEDPYYKKMEGRDNEKGIKFEYSSTCYQLKTFIEQEKKGNYKLTSAIEKLCKCHKCNFK